MQTIPIALAEAGMVLARDILRHDNPNGPPVCGKGISLTDALIERLKIMGISSVVVEGHPVPIDGEQTLEEMMEALDARFRKVDADPLMRKLRECYRNIIIRSMEGNCGGRQTE